MDCRNRTGSRQDHEQTLRLRLRVLLASLVLVAAGSPAAKAAYWNVFNVEGESSLTADIVTYATLPDMLTDSNRTGVFSPNAGGAGRNVIGSGSDGTRYWNVFNVEGESSLTADIVTYATLADMLTDTNRTGVFSPNTGGAGRNVIGSGGGVPSKPPPPGAVPEPTTLGLLASGVLGLALLRRRRAAV